MLKKIIVKSKWIYSLVKNVPFKTLLELATQKKQKKSIIFFTQHKSASTFAAKILSNIGSANLGLKHVNYPNLISDVGCYFKFGERYSNENDWYFENCKSLFKNNGYIYGPHRAPFMIPEIDLFKKIIFLRDPRDSLISRYYSFGFNHGVPKDSAGKKIFLDERSKIIKESIDSYCERMAAEWCKPLLSSYIKIIKSSFEPILFITYEQYVENPSKVLSSIFKYCEIDDCNELSASLARQAQPIRLEINVKAHQRSGRVSQYLTELKQATIININNTLKEEMEFFEWNT
jgi:hypothetical protein